ncbi:hypothetical protein TNCV_2126401 [Trichonephila clavipes]|nr:hypothetical protein TNCV_2126401 [Trichonephila clavipes]
MTPELAAYSLSLNKVASVPLHGESSMAQSLVLARVSSSFDRSSSPMSCGRGSLVVKVTDSRPACHEFDPSTAQDPPLKGSDLYERFWPTDFVILNHGQVTRMIPELAPPLHTTQREDV